MEKSRQINSRIFGGTQFTSASVKSNRAAQIRAARATLLMFQTRKLGSQCTVVPTRGNTLHSTTKKSKKTHLPSATLQDVGLEGKGLLGEYPGKGLLGKYPGKGLLGKYPGIVPVANMKRAGGVALPTGTSSRSLHRAVYNSQQKDIPCTTKPNKLGFVTKFPVDLFAALKTFIENEKVGEEEDIVYEPKNQLQAYKGPGVYSFNELLVKPLEPIAPQVTPGTNVGNPNSNFSSNEGGNMKTRKIFVAGLPPTLKEDGFRQYFETYGHVTDVVIMHDQSTQRCRGSGFISFDSEDAVDGVLQKHFHVLKGNLVMVRRALPKNANPSSSESTTHSAGAYGHPNAANAGVQRWSSWNACGTQGFGYGGAAAGTGGSLSATTRTIF